MHKHHQGSDRRAVRLTCATWALTTTIFAWIILRHLAPVDGQPPATPRAQYAMDFRDTIWLPAKDFLRGNVPWDVAGYKSRYPGAQICPVYTPWYALPALLLLLLPYGLAAGVWTALSLAAACFMLHRACTVLWPGLLARAPWVVPALAAVLFTSRPGRSGLISGNWSLVVASAAALALLSARSSPSVTVLCLLVLVKPQAAIPFVALALARGLGRSLLQALAAAAVLSIPVALATIINGGGVSGGTHLILQTLRVGDEVNTGPTSPNSTRVDFLGNFQRMHFPPAWAVGLGLLLGCALLVAAVLASREPAQRRGVAGLLLPALAILLILPNQSYGYPVLVPGLLALTRDLTHTWRSASSSERFYLCVLGLLLLLPVFDTGPVAAWLGITKLTAASCTALALQFAAGLLAVEWFTLRSARHSAQTCEGAASITPRRPAPDSPDQ